MLTVGVILVQIWCNTLCNDTHDIHDIVRNHTINARYHTYFHDIHDIESVLKTPRDKFLSHIQKLCYGRAFCVLDRRGRRSLQRFQNPEAKSLALLRAKDLDLFIEVSRFFATSCAQNDPGKNNS